MTLTRERLKEILHYDPGTGIWTWLVSPKYDIPAGSKAGSLDSSGYPRIRYRSKYYWCHWLAFFYMEGVWPDEQVDHINGVRDDCRWSNLRCVPRALNGLNRKTYETNTSGCKGVCWHPKLEKWRVRIQKFGKRYALGCYDSLEDARRAYDAAAELHFGEFKRQIEKGEAN